MRIGTKEFDTKHETYVMGILNVTPDSFWDGGKHHELDAALFHAESMIKDGAAILDVGGESTRPGYTPVSAEEELERTIPILEAIKERFDIPISIDTYKGRVAEAAIAAGADMVNDIWGLKADLQMAEVIANTNTACCLMHNRKQADYRNFMEEVVSDLAETLDLARRAGISDEKIVLDPGIGFGKTYEQNLEAIKRLGELRKLGYPILLGASRKSIIGQALGLPAEERLEGTLVTTAFAVWQGCAFVRVHDVKENIRTIRMAGMLL